MSNKNEVKKKKQRVLRVQKKMSVERLKTFKGFEVYTDQKAKETIQQLERFAKIIIRHITKK